MSWDPWEVLHNWKPFSIDALGLVTLLGAEEVNSAVGRLVTNAYLEHLPLLGAFVIAGDRFTEKAAGFNLYNISKGIHTTDLSAWLTRWMLSQDFEVTRNYVKWSVTEPRTRTKEIAIGLIISFVLNGFLVAMTVLSRDWYGFANAISMIVSIMVRSYVIGQQRAAMDDTVVAVMNAAKRKHEESSNKLKTQLNENSPETQTAQCQTSPENKIPSQQASRELRQRKATNGPVTPTNGSETVGSSYSNDPKKMDFGFHSSVQQGTTGPLNGPKRTRAIWTGDDKVLIIQADSKAVTFSMPNELLAPPSVFIEGPIIKHPQRYFLVRSIGWLFFAVHIVAIGMAKLSSQLYTVALLVLPTILFVLKQGCDDSRWLATWEKWKKRYFKRNRQNDSEKASKATTGEDATKFVWKRECWIGSRLKADIYEWPASYEFAEKVKGQDDWYSGAPENWEEKERSKKRQDLYAWLALTTDEEESMDKWDLFPHIRHNNTSWWKTYKSKKRCLKCNEHFGPQSVRKEDDPDRDPNELQNNLRRSGRTRTENFDQQPARTSSVITSSAFPAISHHPHSIVLENASNPADTLLLASGVDGVVDIPRTASPEPASDAGSRHSPNADLEYQRQLP